MVKSKELDQTAITDITKERNDHSRRLPVTPEKKTINNFTEYNPAKDDLEEYLKH